MVLLIYLCLACCLACYILVYLVGLFLRPSFFRRSGWAFVTRVRRYPCSLSVFVIRVRYPCSLPVLAPFPLEKKVRPTDDARRVVAKREAIVVTNDRWYRMVQMLQMLQMLPMLQMLQMLQMVYRWCTDRWFDCHTSTRWSAGNLDSRLWLSVCPI